MPAKRLDHQFPTFIERRFEDLDEANKVFQSLVRAVEEFRKRLASVVGDHADTLDGLNVPTFTDATRGAAGTKGRVIFNEDDGQLNIDDGTNWTLPDGTTT